MKSKRDVDGGKARVYVTTTYVPELRTAFARLYRAWKERGQKKDEFLSLLSEAGYPVPERTLNQWTASVRSDGSAIRPVKRSGCEFRSIVITRIGPS